MDKIVNYNNQKLLEDNIDKLALDLLLPKEDLEYLKSFNLKDTKIVNSLDQNKIIPYDKINELANLISKSKSNQVKEKLSQLKKNIIENTIHSNIDTTISKDYLTYDLIKLVNSSLNQVNNNFEKKILEEDPKCPARLINIESLDCGRQNQLKIHPDKNNNCIALANSKFLEFQKKCVNENINEMEGGSSKEDLNRVSQKISNSLQFTENNKKIFNGFFNSLNIPEMSKTFDEIRNMISSESIDKKIYNYQIDNSSTWSESTKEKYEEFKRNVATLEILSIIEKFKKVANDQGTFTDDEVEDILAKFIDILNNTFSTNNKELRLKNFINYQNGGSNELDNFKDYLKYKKYKEKYLILKKII